MQALGCVEALNLDGGGSSCLLINGKETIKPCDKEGQRPVPAVFLVHAKK
jgi:exopolysaccharide biosynthesis protein